MLTSFTISSSLFLSPCASTKASLTFLILGPSAAVRAHSYSASLSRRVCLSKESDSAEERPDHLASSLRDYTV